MKNALASIKRAPKWAWYTVGGVAVGGTAIKLYANRDAPEADQAASEDGSGIGDGTTTVSGSPTPVIVPPVLVGNDQGDAVPGGVGQLHDSYIGAIADVLGESTAITGGAMGQVFSTNEQLTRTLTDLATAGSAPAPAAANPTPVKAINCGGKYPFYDPKTKLCFRVYQDKVTQKRKVTVAAVYKSGKKKGKPYKKTVSQTVCVHRDIKQNSKGQKKVLKETVIKKGKC